MLDVFGLHCKRRRRIAWYIMGNTQPPPSPSFFCVHTHQQTLKFDSFPPIFGEEKAFLFVGEMERCRRRCAFGSCCETFVDDFFVNGVPCVVELTLGGGKRARIGVLLGQFRSA